jgi:hypothetical protein
MDMVVTTASPFRVLMQTFTQLLIYFNVQITSQRTPSARVRICTWISGILPAVLRSVANGSKTRGKQARKRSEQDGQEANNAIKRRKTDGEINVDGAFRYPNNHPDDLNKKFPALYRNQRPIQ